MAELNNESTLIDDLLRAMKYGSTPMGGTSVAAVPGTGSLGKAASTVAKVAGATAATALATEAAKKALSKDEKDNLMVELVENGLDTSEMKDVMKKGYISELLASKLPKEALNHIENIYGFPVGTKSTSIPIPEKKKGSNTETFPFAPKKKERVETIPETKKEKGSNTETFPSELDFETGTPPIEIPEKDLNDLIDMMKDWPEASQKQIVDWTMSPAGIKKAKELGITPTELGQILWEASMQNTAAKAQQEEYEAHKHASAESRMNAKNDARKTAARGAERNDERLKDMGLNQYVKHK